MHDTREWDPDIVRLRRMDGRAALLSRDLGGLLGGFGSAGGAGDRGVQERQWRFGWVGRPLGTYRRGVGVGGRFDTLQARGRRR